MKMTVEYFGGDAFPRLLVTVEASELEGYGVTYSAMSPEDGPTRALLSDLLSLVTAMGLRKKGQRLRVDCVSTRGGGCALLISRAESRESAAKSICLSAFSSMERLTMSGSVPSTSESRSSLPSQSVFSGSSRETSALVRLWRRRNISTSFSMHRLA